jgi:hypothetical protein
MSQSTVYISLYIYGIYDSLNIIHYDTFVLYQRFQSGLSGNCHHVRLPSTDYRHIWTCRERDLHYIVVH